MSPVLHAPAETGALLDRAGRPAGRHWRLSPHVLHLNHGSFGAVPTTASRHRGDLVTEADTDPVAWYVGLPVRVAAARAQVARYLAAPEEATALVPNASAAVSVVLRSLRLRAGAEVVVTDHGYGAVRMAAARAVAAVGGRVRTARVPLDAADADVVAAVEAETTDATALVVLDQITSPTARLMPVAAVARTCAPRGVRLLVDGAHAPGMLAEPLAGAEGADYWVGNLHKWACAPGGSAALVATGEAAQALHPLIESWAGDQPYPVRFDTQGTLDATPYLATPAALDAVEREIGWGRVRAHMAALADAAEALVADALEAATGQGARTPATRPAPAMRLLALPAGLVGDEDGARALGARIAEEHRASTAITCWRGAGYLRLSVHAYNTPDDYAAFAERVVPTLADLARRAARPHQPSRPSQPST